MKKFSFSAEAFGGNCGGFRRQLRRLSEAIAEDAEAIAEDAEAIAEANRRQLRRQKSRHYAVSEATEATEAKL